MQPTLLLDNGGGTIKSGVIFSRSSKPSPIIIPNALGKPAKNAIQSTSSSLAPTRRPAGMLVGRELLTAPDVSGMTLRRAHDRGVVSLWDVQRDVWFSALSTTHGVGISTSSIPNTRVVVTETPGIPIHARRAMDELVFETFGFVSCAVCPAARLAAAISMCDTALVIDSGFSCTLAVPVVDGYEIMSSVRRLAVGGKALTNHLKELVSFRSWNMMDETVVMNTVKERLCYVADDYVKELSTVKEGHKTQAYVLPDLSRVGTDKLGHVLKEDEEQDGTEQVLLMGNERIAVPELLFNPSDVGLKQAGVAELAYQAVESCPEEYRAALYENVILVGGNCNFPGFKKRFEKELRPLVADHYKLKVTLSTDPTTAAFQGGVEVLRGEADVDLSFVSKKMYQDMGSDAILRHFYGDEDDET